MSFLKPGTLCIIVSGHPENIGLIVEIIAHLGQRPSYIDAYRMRTVSGRFIPKLRMKLDGPYVCGNSNEATIDRHRLRPLVDLKDEPEVCDTAVEV
jgi:hypothetical protein